ncbi:MAG: ribosome silencing factor [Candidatus Baltobacteraceae bacterium]
MQGARALAADARGRGNLWRSGGYGIGELIDVVREAAVDKKGEGFTALDVSGRTILADTFAIVTGRSKVQTRAIADAVTEAVKKGGHAVSRVEGHADGSWILIDLGNVIVHVFTPEQREFYNLERLWAPLELVRSEDAKRRVEG